MPKLSDHNPAARRKVLVVGPSGTGKTVFALAFPGRKFVFDFDSKISSGAAYYANDRARLEEVEYEDFGPKSGLARPMQNFEAHLRELEKRAAAGDFPYMTIVLDSFTTLAAKLIEEIVLSNSAIARTKTRQGDVASQLDYRINKQYGIQLIHRLLSLPAHFVLTAHIHVEKDELSGRLERRALGPEGLATYLPIVFEEVYRTYVEGEGDKRRYMAQTQANDYFAARSQIRGLPAVIPLTYEALGK